MKKMLTVLFVLVSTALLAQNFSSTFEISAAMKNQGYAQVAYNTNADEYLVVWEDNRNSDTDIYGQFVQSNGTLKGKNFPICTVSGDQYWPRLDFDPINNRFLIVFEDWRNTSNGDIRGVFVNSDGTFYNAPTSDAADHTFLICSNSADIYTCSVAFNFISMRYLVVWGDFRNDPQKTSYTGEDVYGQLVGADGTLLSPPSPADPAVNFPIAAEPDYPESVADVTYSGMTNEFFVVYGTNGWVYGQRVNCDGELINAHGETVGKSSGDTGIQISQEFNNGPDCMQSRVQANNEGIMYVTKSSGSWCEVEVVWKGRGTDKPDNDVYGQKIGFVEQSGKYVAKYINIDGVVTDNVSNHPISIQNDWVGVTDIAYSSHNNEFLVAWGDPRTGGYAKADLYSQLLGVNSSTLQMSLLSADRTGTVGYTDNIPLEVSDNYSGSLLGIAHSISRNEFLIAYTFEDKTMNRGSDIYGIRFYGNTTSVEQNKSAAVPEEFQITGNYPNPFNPETHICFELPVQGLVKVEIFDLTGRKINRIKYVVMESGYHSVVWNGKDVDGFNVSSGVYLYSVKLDNIAKFGKMTLVR